MFGILALLSAFAGIAALYLRVGVLDRHSLPQHLATLFAIVFGSIEWKRRRSRLAAACGALAIVVSVLFSGALEYFTRYGGERPNGPEVGASLADLHLSDVAGAAIELSGEKAAPLTLLSCFRGFW